MSTRLFVVRHGQTQFNVEGRIQGWKNSPLTAAGQAQALIVKDWLTRQNVHIQAAYSSDLGRALETAKLITEEAIPIHAVQSLREISFGDLDGTLPSANDPEQWDDQAARIHGGETVTQAARRSMQGLGQIARTNTGKDVLVITHGFILNVLLELCPKLPSVHLDRLHNLENGTIVELIYTAGKLWSATVATPVSDWISHNLPSEN